ncbi:potassium-transporting ATPase subunit KdpC [Massilia varians]|jgi:potassium-transporting ATPase KdpC subunit|uniref:potassium-transporting ATPase subunit KdpC n=1 Tax=Massilia varians TaxID=457921 RepID=UPI002553FB08|nr:potassium-transporting ATPase subunit KdpC [Massilia varians]MDK6079251.1 potassium-transporting ATPase subunit KdpC [Massilia varians]
MQSVIRPALVLFGALTLLCGLAYPLLVTGIAQAAFPEQANGSLVKQGEQVVGSRLIGQHFSVPQYFWGRPSSTGPMPNNGAGSSGSNQGPLNPALQDAVKGRIATLRAADPDNRALIPVDLVTASASGLDPEISLAGARWQAARVARARGLSRAQVESMIDAHAQDRVLGLFGEPRVNVLALNLALDAAPDMANRTQTLHTR